MNQYALFGGKRRSFIQRRSRKRMLHECIPTLGGTFFRILENDAVPTGCTLIQEQFIYQENTDSKDTAKVARNYFHFNFAKGVLHLIE